MNEEIQKTHEQPVEGQEDWFLQFLVNVFDGDNSQMSITLQVSGFLVSGDLVSAENYFKGCASAFASPSSNPEDINSMEQAFLQFGELAKAGKESLDGPPPAY